MNLKRLLTVGGSVEARQGASGRYRMARPGALPKFELRGDVIRAVPMEGIVRPTDAKRPASPGPLFDGPMEPACPEPTKAKGTNPFSAEASSAPLRVSIWKRIFAGLVALWRDAFSGRRGRARKQAARAAVQSELGLENVRPIRNDLSGSDIEVVAVPVAPPPPGLILRSVADTAPEAAASPKPESPAGRSPLRKWAGQLLGAKD